MEIKVLVVKPNKKPKVYKIDNNIKSIKNIINGELQYVELENGIYLISDKNGKKLDLEFNRVITDDIVAGDFIIVGCKREKLVSLDRKQIRKYKKHFRLKADDGVIEFCRIHIVKSSNLLDPNINLKGVEKNRGYIVK